MHGFVLLQDFDQQRGAALEVEASDCLLGDVVVLHEVVIVILVAGAGCLLELIDEDSALEHRLEVLEIVDLADVDERKSVLVEENVEEFPHVNDVLVELEAVEIEEVIPEHV